MMACDSSGRQALAIHPELFGRTEPLVAHLSHSSVIFTESGDAKD